MEVKKLDELFIVTPEKFSDHRGIYIETFNKKDFEQNVIDINFVQDDISRSSQGVFRGLHGDNKTWKLISCPDGDLSLIVLNCNPNSSFFGKSYMFNLNTDQFNQILIPPMHANGHFINSPTAVFNYKQSTYYTGAEEQFSINIDSKIIDHTHKDFDIRIRSERDTHSQSIGNKEELQNFIQKYV